MGKNNNISYLEKNFVFFFKKYFFCYIMRKPKYWKPIKIFINKYHYIEENTLGKVVLWKLVIRTI